MENLPGPLLYQILKYTGIIDVLILECLSIKIQSKLRGNLSAFQYALEKHYKIERTAFDESKASLQSVLSGPTSDVEFIHYYTNGGHYDTYWSINHLSNRRDGVYCSSNDAGHNIIVKAINVAEGHLQNHYRDRWNPSEALI